MLRPTQTQIMRCTDATIASCRLAVCWTLADSVGSVVYLVMPALSTASRCWRQKEESRADAEQCRHGLCSVLRRLGPHRHHSAGLGSDEVGVPLWCTAKLMRLHTRYAGGLDRAFPCCVHYGRATHRHRRPGGADRDVLYPTAILGGSVRSVRCVYSRLAHMVVT